MINELELTNEQHEDVLDIVGMKSKCDGCGNPMKAVRGTICCFKHSAAQYSEHRIDNVIKYVVLCIDCYAVMSDAWGLCKKRGGISMNLYLVVSEQLSEVVWEDWFNNVGHEEPYCIAELVVAEKPSQAKYLAWRSDKNSSCDVTEMPKMSCEKLVTDVNHTKGVVSNHPSFEHYWEETE